MIPASPRERQTTLQRRPSVWQLELAAAITDPAELLAALDLDRSLLAPARAAAGQFGLLVPRGFLARMRRGDPHDPLLRQVLPLGAELAEVPGFTGDPLHEHTALRAPGLLHKYAGRALMVTTGACAVHCRYCFRREFPYAGQQADGPRWQAAVRAIAADPSIEEVILSGGDPLVLADARLAALTAQLAGLAHVQRLRIHTRLPVVLPSRVDEGLLGWLGTLPWPAVIVLHTNHPREIDEAVAHACARLRGAGALLLNQSVLLAGVNDSAGILAELSRTLFGVGVLPYYLHLLDRVRGTAHLEVTEAAACRIAGELAARLPGYLMPRLVRETAGAAAKRPIAFEVPQTSV